MAKNKATIALECAANFLIDCLSVSYTPKTRAQKIYMPPLRAIAFVFIGFPLGMIFLLFFPFPFIGILFLLATTQEIGWLP